VVRSFDCCGDRDTRELACSAEVIDLSDSSWIANLGPSSHVILAGGCEDSVDSLELLSRVDPRIVPDQYKEMRDWRNWRQWALEAGIKFPSTYTLHEWLDMRPAPTVELAEDVTQPSRRWLWKKQRSAGGLGVRFFDPTSLLESSSSQAYYSPESGLLQEYLSGKSIGVSFLSTRHGTAVLGMSESIPHQPHLWSDFIYRGSIAPVLIPDWINSSIYDFASTVACSTGWQGIWQADLLLRGHELYLLEINPRWTASMELIAYGYDLPLVTWHANCHQFVEYDWRCIQSNLRAAHEKTRSRFRKEVLYALDDWIVSADECDSWWQRRWIARESDESGLWYADIPQAHSSLLKGAPVCSVIELVV
jgi:predicted ATP-grasp superfamily ATP-dependent carboligase